MRALSGVSKVRYLNWCLKKVFESSTFKTLPHVPGPMSSNLPSCKRICYKPSEPFAMKSWLVILNMRDTIRISHLRLTTDGFAIRDSSLAIREVLNQLWRVTNRYSPFVTGRLSRESRVTSRRSWVARRPDVTRNFESWLTQPADYESLGMLSRESRIASGEWRAASRNSWLKAKSRVTTDGKLWSS